MEEKKWEEEEEEDAEVELESGPWGFPKRGGVKGRRVEGRGGGCGGG